jgi:hypothetical protein
MKQLLYFRNVIISMKKISILFSIFVVLLLAASTQSCKHHPDGFDINTDDNGNNGGGGPDTLVIENPHPCDQDSVYFTNTIQPLLNSMCAVPECHDAITAEDGVNLTNYQNIMNQVDPFDLDGSDLWDKGIMDPDEPMPPADSPQLTQEEINLIEDWIMQGALNNSCQEDCDPLAFSYSVNLAPIIDGFCDGCHGGANPEAGFALGTHAQLVYMVENATNGFMNCLNNTNGAPIMPPNTLGLPDCYKQQFQNWIDAGMPNN